MNRSGTPLSTFQLPNGKQILQINEAETSLQYRNIFVDRCYLKGRLSLGAGDVFVDVGANVGLASLFAHWFAPDMRVFAFEPAGLMFEALERNFAAHRLRGVALPCALGGSSEERELVIYPEKTSMSGFYADPARDLEITRLFLENTGFDEQDIDDFLRERPSPLRERVSVTTLSDWWETVGLDRIDLLKINVERAELDVLAGVRAEHWPKIRQIAMQVHEEVETPQALRRMLEARGFRVTISSDPLLAGTGIYEAHAMGESPS